MNNNKLTINKHIFKYGREPRVISFNTKRDNATFDIDIADNVKFFINKRIVDELTTNINRYINNTTLEENITNITNNIEFEVPKNLSILSISLSSDETDTQDRIFMNNDYHFTSSIIVSNQNNYSNLNIFNAYSFVTNKKIFVDNDIILKNKIITVKNDNNLYYNNIKLTNNQYEEIYNNISSWCIDEDNNQYTFSKVAINSSNNEDYELLVNGDAKISNDLTIGNNLTVNGIIIDGGGEVGEDFVINADLVVHGNITVDGSGSIGTDFTIGNDLDVSGNITVDGSGSIGTDFTIGNDLDVSGNITVDGGGYIGTDLTVGQNIYFGDTSNRLYVNSKHIYFNGCKLDNCQGDNVEFFLAADYNDTDLVQLESDLQTALLDLDSTIDFTNLEFSFTNVA